MKNSCSLHLYLRRWSRLATGSHVSGLFKTWPQTPRIMLRRSLPVVASVPLRIRNPIPLGNPRFPEASADVATGSHVSGLFKTWPQTPRIMLRRSLPVVASVPLRIRNPIPLGNPRFPEASADVATGSHVSGLFKTWPQTPRIMLRRSLPVVASVPLRIRNPIRNPRFLEASADEKEKRE